MFSESEVREQTGKIVEAYNLLTDDFDIQEFLLIRKAAIEELSVSRKGKKTPPEKRKEPSGRQNAGSRENKTEKVYGETKDKPEEKKQNKKNEVSSKAEGYDKDTDGMKSLKTTEAIDMDVEEIEPEETQPGKKTAFEILRSLEDPWN